VRARVVAQATKQHRDQVVCDVFVSLCEEYVLLCEDYLIFINLCLVV
jgi:hypothetical protein